MGEINYESLVLELIKPLVTHPEDVFVTVTNKDGQYVAVATVNPCDLGRVIGKKGRVASAIRTLAHAAAMRNDEEVDVKFTSPEEQSVTNE
jgi:predicted RNA-binding protein YlqC (UPF0109 family)